MLQWTQLNRRVGGVLPTPSDVAYTYKAGARMADSIQILESRNPYVVDGPQEPERVPGADEQRVYHTFHVPPALRQTAYEINLQLTSARRLQNAEKQRARKTASRAIKIGRLVRPKTCQQCGIHACRIDGHHADYTQPLLIEWLCLRCHGAADRRRHIREYAELQALGEVLEEVDMLV